VAAYCVLFHSPTIILIDVQAIAVRFPTGKVLSQKRPDESLFLNFVVLSEKCKIGIF
jgi:hypothetical protein